MRSHLLLCLLVAAGLAGLGGCARQATAPTEATSAMPSAPAPGPSATPTGPATEVRFTYSEKACYLPVIVAVEEGYYADAGLKIVKKVVTGGIESAEALISAQADVGTMGDAPAVIALSRDPNLRLIAGQAVGPRMHRIVVRNDSGIKQPRDLEGKRVADQMGSSTHGGLLLYCKKNLVDPAKIKFVSLSPRDFPEAMIAEQVDAIVGSEPWPGNVMSKCKDCTEFANLKDLGNSYPLPIIARSSFLTEHPEAARAIVAGTRRAVELIKSDPGRAAQVIANVSGLPVEREQKAMADYDWSVELDEAVLESLKLTAQFLKEQKKIEAVPDLVGLLDRSGFAPAAGN